MNAPVKAIHNATILIDAGHGSLDRNGKYTTPAIDGKYYDHKDKTLNFHGIKGNSVFYEGVNNRALANYLKLCLNRLGIQALFLHDEIIDTPRQIRINRANLFWETLERRTFLVSLHSNAGKGAGWEYFTSVGKTASDQIGIAIAEAILPLMQANKINIRGGKEGKEANFDMVRLTKCPAVLIEHDFFDTLIGAKRLNEIHTDDTECSYIHQLIQHEAKGIAAAHFELYGK